MRHEMRVSFPGGKRVSAHLGSYQIDTDQPIAAGGEGSAPSPFDLLLASLAACTGFYVTSFCHSRDLPVGDIGVTMSWIRGEDRPIDDVEIRIETPADFPSRYLRPLERAAAHCTVKRALASPPTIRVEVAQAPAVEPQSV